MILRLRLEDRELFLYIICVISKNDLGPRREPSGFSVIPVLAHLHLGSD